MAVPIGICGRLATCQCAECAWRPQDQAFRRDPSASPRGKPRTRDNVYSGEDVVSGRSGCCGGEYTQEMQQLLGEWKEAFEKHGLKISMEKTEVM